MCFFYTVKENKEEGKKNNNATESWSPAKSRGRLYTVETTNIWTLKK